MIWGCISWNGVGIFTPVNGNINTEKYQDILEEKLWPVIVRYFQRGGHFFQADNATVHQARFIQEYIARNGINCLSWPTKLPGINIIENLKRKLQLRVSYIKT
jgi:hypothetical protein